MDKKIEKKKWTPKKIGGIAGAALFGIFVLYTFVFADKSSKLNVETERITISTVRQGPFQEFIPVTGSVEPIKTFFLDVTEGGRIVEKFVEEGAFLEEGMPIIRLENTQTVLTAMFNEANVMQVENNLRGTRLQMEQTKLNNSVALLNAQISFERNERAYKRDKKLYEKQLISEYDFLDSEENYKSSKRTLQLTVDRIAQDSVFQSQQIVVLEKNLERMRRNYAIVQRGLDDLTVKAPIRGQLTSLNGEIGQTIRAGENLGRIDNIDSYKIRVGIDEHYLARINVGQTGTFNFDNETHALEIKTVYPQVINGRFFVDMHFSGEMPNVRRGQTVHIRLALGDLSEAILVNSGGFYQSTGGQWVFVINESETEAVRRRIRIGRHNTMEYEVLEGLQPGEKVITSSYDNYGDVEKLILN